MRAATLREDSIMPMHWTETFRIAETHPALSGHFPERAVVPGVILLDRVTAAIERRTATHVAGLPQAKFLRPLLPGQEATLTFDANDGSARFHIAHEGEAVATGVVALAAGVRA